MSSKRRGRPPSKSVGSKTGSGKRRVRKAQGVVFRGSIDEADRLHIAHVNGEIPLTKPTLKPRAKKKSTKARRASTSPPKSARSAIVRSKSNTKAKRKTKKKKGSRTPQLLRTESNESVPVSVSMSLQHEIVEGDVHRNSITKDNVEPPEPPQWIEEDEEITTDEEDAYTLHAGLRNDMTSTTLSSYSDIRRVDSKVSTASTLSSTYTVASKKQHPMQRQDSLHAFVREESTHAAYPVSSTNLKSYNAEWDRARHLMATTYHKPGAPPPERYVSPSIENDDEAVNVVVRFNTQSIILLVRQATTIAGIKEKIQARKDIPVEDQILTRHSDPKQLPLNDYHRLAAYGIRPNVNNILHLNLKSEIQGKGDKDDFFSMQLEENHDGIIGVNASRRSRERVQYEMCACNCCCCPKYVFRPLACVRQSKGCRVCLIGLFCFVYVCILAGVAFVLRMGWV